MRNLNRVQRLAERFLFLVGVWGDGGDREEKQDGKERREVAPVIVCFFVKIAATVQLLEILFFLIVPFSLPSHFLTHTLRCFLFRSMAAPPLSEVKLHCTV